MSSTQHSIFTDKMRSTPRINFVWVVCPKAGKLLFKEDKIQYNLKFELVSSSLFFYSSSWLLFLQSVICQADKTIYFKSSGFFFFIINIFVTILLQHLQFKDNFKGILKETRTDNQGKKHLLLDANLTCLQLFHICKFSI